MIETCLMEQVKGNKINICSIECYNVFFLRMPILLTQHVSGAISWTSVPLQFMITQNKHKQHQNSLTNFDKWRITCRYMYKDIELNILKYLTILLHPFITLRVRTQNLQKHGIFPLLKRRLCVLTLTCTVRVMKVV